MTLHGEVKVNHNEIAGWEAVRVGVVDKSKPKDNHFVYRCNVIYRDMQGYQQETGPFLIHHYFDDGALILASKVLTDANTLYAQEKLKRLQAARSMRDKQ